MILFSAIGEVAEFAELGLALKLGLTFSLSQHFSGERSGTLDIHSFHNGKNSKGQEATCVSYVRSYVPAIPNTALEVTVHSRAARRAASPSIDVDKKLKQTTRDSASPSRPSQTKHHALAAQNAGIQKKTKKGNMTRAQRLRHQKGLERAADVIDKRHVKVVKSLDKEKTVKERSKGWEDVNGDGKKKKSANAFEELDADAQQTREEREWVSDEEMDDTEAEGQQGSGLTAEEVKGEGKPLDAVVPESIPLPVEEDELL